jgi:hypothetical protein
MKKVYRFGKECLALVLMLEWVQDMGFIAGEEKM